MMDLILTKNYAGIREALQKNPQLAEEGLTCGDGNPVREHPLHRICDYIFSGKITDEEGVIIAKIFLEFGANVNGYELVVKKDTPLLAASSLHADKVALLYIERGADINHAGCHGGTALHWAAWCGRDIVVKKLIEEGADINKKCIDFEATPLFWATLNYTENPNNGNQPECARLLLAAGADKNISNGNGKTIDDLISDQDAEFKKIFNY